MPWRMDLANLKNMMVEISIQVPWADFLKSGLLEHGFVVWFSLFGARRNTDIAKLETSREHKHFSMSGITFVFQTTLSEPDDTIEYSHFLLAVGSLADPAFDLEFKNLCEPFFIRQQAITWPQSGEIVTVNHY